MQQQQQLEAITEGHTGGQLRLEGAANSNVTCFALSGRVSRPSISRQGSVMHTRVTQTEMVVRLQSEAAPFPQHRQENTYVPNTYVP